ncbi:MAG: glycosyltransferase involved in cell wall biosynthesis [Planctomycetota bacterium]|jgi:glycosyltransferase involved in cell wall biosynthesis
MKILHVITTLDVGGAEKHLESQVRGQTGRGHQVRIAYMKGQGTLAGDFRRAGAEDVLMVPLGPGVSRIITHMRWADIVHSHLLKADMFTALIATLAGCRSRLVSGKHNDEQVLMKPLVSFVHGILGNLPRRTIALSDHVARFVHRWGKVRAESMRRVYYGIDRSRFEAAALMEPEARAEIRDEFGFGKDDVVFICVARFAEQKAHDVLLKALRSALDRSGDDAPRIRLLLVGGDPFGNGEERAKAWATELNLGESCVFAGIRHDVPLLMAASDVFTMSSLWEGLGLVFLEAMATDIPVLATRVSAVPEVVIDGETGVLVPPAEFEPLADAMLELASDPGRRRQLGLAGHGRVTTNFGLDRMVDQTLDIYRELTEGREPDTATLAQLDGEA